MFYLEDGRQELFQWDIDVAVIVENENITEVHFANRRMSTALVCKVENGKVYIPNILLQEHLDIKMFAWDKNYTKYEKIFVVNKRPKPENYIYTETQLYSVQQIAEEVVEKALEEYDAEVQETIKTNAEQISNNKESINILQEQEETNSAKTQDLDERMSYLESFNLEYTEVSSNTGIIKIPNNEFVGKKAFLNSFGGMTRRWEGITYTATAGTSYGVYSYGAPFTLSAGRYRLVGGAGLAELRINDTIMSNPFTLTETTEITSFFEESGAAVGDGSTHTIYPYLLDVDTNTAIPFPNTWLGLQDTKPTEIKVHDLNLIPNTRDIYLRGAGGLTYIDNGNGSYYVSGTATGAPSYIAININKAFPAGTYTFYGFSNGSKDTYRLRYMFNNKTVDVYNGGGVVAVLDKGYVLQQILLVVQNGITVNNLLYYPMVVIGKQFNLPFTPYKEPVTTPIPDAIQNLPNYGKGISADYCNKVDLEKQTYTEQMETYTITGNENWQPAANGRMLIPTADTPLNKSAVLNTAVCNRFTLVPYAQITTSPVGSFCILSGGGIQFITNFSTVSEWKTWLAEQNGQGNPVIIAYAKAEPTITSLPVALDGLVEVEQGEFIEIVTDTGKGVLASATFIVPRE